MLEIERLKARKKLTETEKELSSIIFQQTNGSSNFAIIRSKGDTAFFGGKSTQDMKIIWNTGPKPIADFMPTILLKAKDFAAEITIHNAKDKNMKTENQISNEHVINNRTVRETLIGRGITPERLKPSEDMKKVERKINSENKKEVKILLKNKAK
jgi:DNA-damage-inducible protein D